MGLVLVLLSCSVWQSGLKPDPSSPVYRFPEGAELALLDNVETDDVAYILGIERWKFKFTAPKNFSLENFSLGYELELRQPGQAARKLFSSSSWYKPEDKALDEEILLALQPLGLWVILHILR